ncbi:MAG: oligosaccharide flippase family protein [Rhodocyclaceae bacterium]|nr:oligosaccharide flippase family protein [Rhodocyclaceae bacterium]
MLRAAGWLFAGNLSAQVLRLASSLILTRLLVPEAFGLMAAVSTLYFGLLMFSDLGIWQSVVRSRRGDDPRFLGTAWTMQILRGVVLALGVLSLALLVRFGATQNWFADGTVYADPLLPWLMAAFAVCALIQGFESMQLATAQRDMAARPMVRLELVTQLATIAITILVAWVTRSVWALLAGTLAGAFLKTALSYTMLPGRRVRPCWDTASAHEIIGFGKWIFISSIIGFLALQGEKLILGGLLGVAAFGVFSIASNLFAAVVALYSTLNGRVIFTSLSLVLNQEDRPALVRVYTRMQQLADLVLGLLSGLLLMAGHWIVTLLYDARYADAGWMLQCLGLGLLAMRHQVLEQLMFALGQPGWVTANNALRTLGLAVLVPAGFALAGAQGALWGVVASQFASWPLSLYFKHREGLLNGSTERWWPVGIALGVGAGWSVDSILAWLL